jgi:MFS family permease
MLAVIRPVAQVLLAVVCLEAALGALSPLIGVQMLRLRAPTELIGIVTSAYFVGFLAGTQTCHVVIDRVGHIRAYSALAVLAANATILHLIVPQPWLWIAFRALTGYALAGMFVVVESWLNDKTTSQTRGRTLGLYMIASWGASGLGPLALNIPDPDGRLLFGLSAMALSLSLIPMALTRIGNPEIRDRAHFGIRRLYRLSPLGVLACFGSGLINASIWGLLPVYVESVGLSPHHLSIMLTLGVVGALMVQFPAGWLADRFGRRPLILAQALVGAGLCIGIAVAGASSFVLLVALVVLLCATLAPLYALGVAQTNDYISRRDFVAASSGLLFAWGVGSTIGPTITAAVMGPLGGRGLFIFLAAALAAIAAFVVVRMSARPAPAPATPFIAVPASTGVQGAPELDPRSEPADRQGPAARQDA